MAADDASYPRHWEADVVLRDGRTCHLRPMTPDDADRLRAFHARLSPETIYRRFFAPYPELTDRDVARFTQVDHVDRVAIVATVGDELIGVGRYDRLAGADAEVAFTIRDDHQGRGLGSVLLEHLAAAARERGIEQFVAEVLPDNRRMLATFEEAGYRPQRHYEDGVVRLDFDIEPSEASRRVIAEREYRSEASSVQRLLNPRSVAVVGASRTPGRIGHELLRHVRDAGFAGPVYAVHPEADEILGYPCLRHVRDAAEGVDLVVVAVPAAGVLDIVEDAAAAGAIGLIVVSSGFAEAGQAGRDLQRELVSRARGNGLRVLGPNALGLINTDPQLRMNASLSPLMPGRGRIGFFCQSGALGTAILQTVDRRRLGLSTFVSAGNRADVSGNDLLQYWEWDEDTDLVMLYLESVGNPRKFARLARRIGRTKPVVMVRSGRSSQALPLGHTVRRTTLPPAAVDALFDQSGVVQTDSLGELFDVAGVLAFQPLATGPRVGVLSTSEALSVLSVDAVESAGLALAGEPVLLGPDGSGAGFAAALSALVEDPVVNSLLVVHVPSVAADLSAEREMLRAAASRATKPVVAVLVTAGQAGDLIEVPGEFSMPGRGSVPLFTTVEDAVRALAGATKHAMWRSRPRGELPELPDVRTDAARELTDRLLAAAGEDEPVVVSRDGATALLALYGITVWPQLPVASEDEAVLAAGDWGYPVVLKTTVPRLAGRMDLGAVRLNLENDRAVRTAYRSMARSLGADAMAMLHVQPLAPPGVATRVRSREDPLFGPVVAFGLGGTVPELLGDRAYRIPPLTDRDAHDLVREPKAAPMLFGHRGSDPVAVEALEDLLLRLGRLADDLPEVANLDLNPVTVHTGGIAVLDATVTLVQVAGRADLEVRRLSTL